MSLVPTPHQIDIIIPAYNEGRRIEATLRKYLSWFDERVRLTVVLNGCTDNTLSVVQGIAQLYPGRIIVHNIAGSIGKGGAVLYGWQQSPCDVIGFVDADGATPPEEYQKLLDQLGRYDGAIASRTLPGSQIEQRQSTLRSVMSRAFSIVVRQMFHMPFDDTQCGAKVFHRRVLAPVVGYMQTRDMTFDVELLARLHRNGAKVIEIPTRWIDQPGSAALGNRADFLRTGSQMVRRLWQLRQELEKTKTPM